MKIINVSLPFIETSSDILKEKYPKLKEIVNFPSILSNGSYIYDLRTKHKYNEIFMNEKYIRELMYDSKKLNPDSGIRIIRNGTFITPELNDEIKFQIKSGYVFDILTTPSVPSNKGNIITSCGYFLP